MASEPIRDPVTDTLLTPQNAAFVIIDYQPVQVNSIASMDRQLLVNNIVGSGIIPRAASGNDKLDTQVNALWEVWSARKDLPVLGRRARRLWDTRLVGFPGAGCRCGRSQREIGEVPLVAESRRY